MLRGALLQQAQHLVGFLHGEHAGGLVEDEQAVPQQELLEDFQFLFLPGGEVADLRPQGHGEGLAVHEVGQRGALPAPAHPAGHAIEGEREVFGDGEVRHQGEVLVDHAQARGVGVARAGEVGLLAVEHDRTAGRAVVAHDALDQGALAGAVAAQQGVEAARGDAQRHAVEGGEGAEAFGEVDHLQPGGRAGRSVGGRRFGFGGERAHRPATTAALVATAPNTPPCISTMLTAAS